MPRANLPTTLKGWIVSLIASMIGFIVGIVALDVLGKWAK